MGIQGEHISAPQNAKTSRTSLAVRLGCALLLGFIGFAALQCPLAPQPIDLGPTEILFYNLGVSSKFLSALNLLLCFAAATAFLSLPRHAFNHLWLWVLATLWALLWQLPKIAEDLSLPRCAFGFVGSALFFYVIAYLARHLLFLAKDRAGKAEMRGLPRRVADLFCSHPFLCPFIALLVCWVPWLVLLYPGIAAPNDTLDQLRQFLGLPSFTSTMAGQISAGVYLNNHHSALHTMLLGLFVQTGEALKSANAGFFAFVLAQMTALAASVAYGLRMLLRSRANGILVACSCALFCLVPLFPVTACCATKDVLFTASAVLLFCLLWENAGDRVAAGRQAAIAICVLLVCLLRSTGIYICVLLLVFAVANALRNRRIARWSGLVAGLLCSALTLGVLYPALAITPGSSGEARALPYQQTALCVIEHQQEFSEEELEEIGAVLDLENLSTNYHPDNCDPVKNTRNMQATDEQTTAFLDLWRKLLLRYPLTCLKCWSDLESTYYSPEDPDAQHPLLWVISTGWLVDDVNIYDQSELYADIGVNIRQGGLDEQGRIALNSFIVGQENMPWGFAFNLPLYVWIALFGAAAAIELRRKDAAAPTLLLLLLAGTLAISPASYLTRYVLPICFMSPMLVTMMTATNPGRALRSPQGSPQASSK